MKRLVIGALMIGAMAGLLAAQGNLLGPVVVLSAGGAVLVPGAPSQSWWDEPSCGRQEQAARRRENGLSYRAYACDPFYARNDGEGNQANVTLATPQGVATPPLAPPPLPLPVRSEMREYHWPSSASNSSATTFSLVSKDGRVESAAMVWVQDDALYYVTPDGRNGSMPIDSIDREASRRRNEDRPISWLPTEDRTKTSANFAGCTADHSRSCAMASSAPRLETTAR